MAIWHTLPTPLPVDASTVWIRPRPWPTAPYKAVWDLASQTFTSVPNSLVIPWYEVGRWRDLP
jgi:hypothetical protein